MLDHEFSLFFEKFQSVDEEMSNQEILHSLNDVSHSEINVALHSFCLST